MDEPIQMTPSFELGQRVLYRASSITSPMPAVIVSAVEPDEEDGWWVELRLIEVMPSGQEILGTWVPRAALHRLSFPGF